MVFGLAAVTAETSPSWPSGRLIEMSMPSVDHWVTKMITTSALCARAAAAAWSVPSLNATLPPPARAWIAASGADGW
jgi:hypothetical protein